MRRVLAVLAVTALGVACHTITEDLPTRPTPIVVTPVQPIVVQPVPAPTPGPTQPAPAQPAQPGTPTPPPTDGGDLDGPDIPNNNAPVARVGATVFFVECNGEPLPGTKGATDAAVGCRVHMDATAKDANGSPTQARHDPRWSFSDESLISVAYKRPFGPVLTVRAPGHEEIWVEIDGVRSNTVKVNFH